MSVSAAILEELETENNRLQARLDSLVAYKGDLWNAVVSAVEAYSGSSSAAVSIADNTVAILLDEIAEQS